MRLAGGEGGQVIVVMRGRKRFCVVTHADMQRDIHLKLCWHHGWREGCGFDFLS